MDRPLFVLEFELTLLSPLLRRLELKERAFRISSVDPKLFRIVNLEAVDPDVDVEVLVDRGEVLNLLIDHEPGMEK